MAHIEALWRCMIHYMRGVCLHLFLSAYQFEYLSSSGISQPLRCSIHNMRGVCLCSVLSVCQPGYLNSSGIVTKLIQLLLINSHSSLNLDIILYTTKKNKFFSLGISVIYVSVTRRLITYQFVIFQIVREEFIRAIIDPVI